MSSTLVEEMHKISSEVPSAAVIHLYSTAMRAQILLKHNIDTLLRGRGQHRKDLAVWCHRKESWISKIMSEDRREFPQKYLDRIGDFFGLAAYELFQPGISALTERRLGERRQGRDRRVGHAYRLLGSLASEVNVYRPAAPKAGRNAEFTSATANSETIVALKRLTVDYERRVTALLSQAESRRQTSSDRRALPPIPERHRTPSGSNSGENDTATAKKDRRRVPLGK